MGVFQWTSMVRQILTHRPVGAIFMIHRCSMKWRMHNARTARSTEDSRPDGRPRHLAAPLHRHNREDEYSFVLEGRMGALLGDDVVEAGPGDLVYKPRGQWHTFWNAGDSECRILEIISPAGFEKFFEELIAAGGPVAAGPEKMTDL